MNIRVPFCLLFLLIVVSASHISRFAQEDTHPNQYLVYDDDDTNILVDTGNGDIEGTQDIINSIFSEDITHLNLIFITHAHPDFFGGVPALVEQFPGAKVEVANEGVHDELVEAAAIFFPTVDFDWANRVRIHSDDDTLDELDLLLLDDFLPAETRSYGMLYNADLNWIITGDSFRNQFHPYLGEPIGLAQLRNWYGNTLTQLLPEGSIGLDENTIYYPGHGKPGDSAKVAEFSNYLRRFDDIVLSCPNTETPIALTRVRDMLIDEYPQFDGEEVLDFMVSNSLWLVAQDNTDPCSIFDVYTFLASPNSTNAASEIVISMVLISITVIMLM